MTIIEALKKLEKHPDMLLTFRKPWESVNPWTIGLATPAKLVNWRARNGDYGPVATFSSDDLCADDWEVIEVNAPVITK